VTVIPTTWRYKQENYDQGRPGHKLRPTSKVTKAKSAGGVAQVVKCLPTKCMVLSSTPSTTIKKEKNLNIYNLLTFSPGFLSDSIHIYSSVTFFVILFLK
jgi:hypothetical protein